MAFGFALRYATAVRNLLLLVLIVSGCVTLVPRDGFQLREDWWVHDQEAIRTQASFELNCPKESLAVQVIAVFDTAFANKVGVTGCGQRATYTRVYQDYDSKWKLALAP